jgi:hypothetical protein
LLFKKVNLFAAPIPPDAPILNYCPSTKDTIPCDWTLKDTFETSTVACRSSEIDGAGDGLFAAKDLPTNMIISYYNGLHIEAGETYNTTSFSYQVQFFLSILVILHIFCKCVICLDIYSVIC